MAQEAKQLNGSHEISPADGYAAQFVLSMEQIEEFLDSLRTKGRIEDTLKLYRRGLERLYQDLAGDKKINRNTLSQWREHLIEEGYSTQTVNSCMTAANGLLNFFGRRDLQSPMHFKKKGKSQLELTRAEYLQLLRTAKLLEKERIYLLVKLFAFVDLPVQDLSKVTVEAVATGWIAVASEGTMRLFHLPKSFQEELLSFAKRRGISSGMIFIKRDGAPINRTTVSNGIRSLCEQANIPLEKGNPRCLRGLYHSTRQEIASQININALVDQMFERMVEAEQESVGWD